MGEQGPELFVPGTGGNVVPNNALGGGAPNVSVNIRNETGQKVEAVQSGVSFDGMSYHANIHLRLLKNNVGGFRDAVQQLARGR